MTQREYFVLNEIQNVLQKNPNHKRIRNPFG